MLIESKYTSPAPRNVAHALAAKPKAMPSAIGVSSPMPLADLATRTREERPAGEKHHGKRDQQARPAHELRGLGAKLVHVGRERVHHHLHGAEGGDEQAPERGTALPALERLLLPRFIRDGVVAHGTDRTDEGRKRGHLWIPRHACAPRRVIHACVRDARLAPKLRLDEPQAGCAADAFKNERRG